MWKLLLAILISKILFRKDLDHNKKKKVIPDIKFLKYNNHYETKKQK